MTRPPIRILLLLGTLVFSSGCLGPVCLFRGENSPLRRPRLTPDTVVLDIFFVRTPLGNPSINEDLWSEIDEQVLAPQLRQQLSQNGLRVGVVTGPWPKELADILLGKTPDSPETALATTEPNQGKANPPTTEAADVSGGKTVSVAEMAEQPSVVGRHLQLAPGKRAEIIASDLMARIPLLLQDHGQVHGTTYENAQGFFAVKVQPQPDGSIQLQLSPELHHGVARTRWLADSGIFRLNTGKPRVTFPDLDIETALLGGSMLVLTCRTDRPGSLGHYFFTTGEEQNQQKVLIIRLSQTQHDGLFQEAPLLRLDDADIR